jgi:predicted phosphodiesterase
MRIFVVSDTHDCPIRELELIPREAKSRRCDCIIHCGDLEDEHFGHPALGELPIWVYRTRMNSRIPEVLPDHWHVLKDDDQQVVEFGSLKKTRIYVNHYLGVDVLRSQLGVPSLQSELSELVGRFQKLYGDEVAEAVRAEFERETEHAAAWPKVMPYTLVDRIRQKFGDIHYVLFGHSHHQFFHVNYDVALVNPGAFGMGYRDYKRSYAIIDTKTWDIVFSKVFL